MRYRFAWTIDELSHIQIGLYLGEINRVISNNHESDSKQTLESIIIILFDISRNVKI